MLMCIKENCLVCLRSYFWFYILKQLMMFDHFKTVVSFGICLVIRKNALTSSPRWWWEKSTSEIDLSYLEWLVWLERLVFAIACMGGLDISTNLESGALLSFSLSNCWFHRQERILIPNSLFSYCYQLQILAAAMFRVPICLLSCYYGWCRISKTMLNLLPSAIFTHWILSCFTVNFVEQFWTKLNMACNCDRYNLIEPNGR
jgi:hypothetical protein